MEYKKLLVTHRRGFAIMALNRPEKLNAIDSEMIEEIVDFTDKIESDENSRVLIITGVGRAFCVGADLNAFPRGAGAEGPVMGHPWSMEPFGCFGVLVKRMKTFRKPILTAINGLVSGGGLSIICLSDIRLASRKARFSAVFVKRGLIADIGATYQLPRIVGRAKALELMWTGDIVDAKEAKEIGLVSKVVSTNQLLSVTIKLAQKIAKGPSVAIELMKRLVYESLETDNFSVQLAYEAWAQTVCSKTNDFEEGLKSFIEKREPNFTGK